MHTRVNHLPFITCLIPLCSLSQLPTVFGLSSKFATCVVIHSVPLQAHQSPLSLPYDTCVCQRLTKKKKEEKRSVFHPGIIVGAEMLCRCHPRMFGAW